ncbi:MAG: BMP family ABC transporter substrate-binding protein [Spirochaetales bacterium]|nr:BMP family ABC transporter substrate-binding protein [Spirochaetales bacterium]
MARNGLGKNMAAALAAALLLASCGTTGGGADTRTEADIVYTKKPVSAAALGVEGQANDASFAALAAEAGRIAAESGVRVELANEALDHYDDARVDERIEAWQAEGRDRLVALSWFFQANVEAAAARHPEARFAILEGGATAPNIVGVRFREQEAAFVAGWAAALVAKDRGLPAVGFLGVLENAFEVSLEAAFGAGARAAWPEVALEVYYLPESGAENREGKLAEALYARGAAAIVLSPYFYMTIPVLEAAALRSASGDPRWVIGLIDDPRAFLGWNPQPNLLVSVTGKRTALAVEALRLLAAEEFEGGRSVALGAAEGAWELSTGNPPEGEPLVPELQSVLERLAADEFELPDFPEERYLGR